MIKLKMKIKWRKMGKKTRKIIKKEAIGVEGAIEENMIIILTLITEDAVEENIREEEEDINMTKSLETKLRK